MRINISLSSKRRERGMAVIVVITLLSIVLIYIAGNLRALHNLGRDLKLVEQRQTRRLEAANARISTNAVPQSQTPALEKKIPQINTDKNRSAKES
jgi:hypothetical protein